MDCPSQKPDETADRQTERVKQQIARISVVSATSRAAAAIAVAILVLSLVRDASIRDR